MEMDIYIYLYIDDRGQSEIRTIQVKKGESDDDLLLKIFEKELKSNTYFSIWKKFNDLDINLRRKIAKEILDELRSRNFNLDPDCNEDLIIYNLYFFYLGLYLGIGESREVTDNILKIISTNLPNMLKLKIMKGLQKEGKIIIEHAKEWQEDREKYEKTIKKLEKKIANLEEQIKYTPGNQGYYEALEDFNHRKN